MATDCASDEMIEAVSFPVNTARCAFREVARRHGDFAIVACAAVAIPGGVRLAVGGVADVPIARDWSHLEGVHSTMRSTLLHMSSKRAMTFTQRRVTARPGAQHRSRHGAEVLS
jgi:CO/xanthine dehydrogenase FAD-binding subunit